MCLSRWTLPPKKLPRRLQKHTHDLWFPGTRRTGSCSLCHHSVTPLIRSDFLNTKCVSGRTYEAKFEPSNLMWLLILLCFTMSRSERRWALCVLCKANEGNDEDIVHHVRLMKTFLHFGACSNNPVHHFWMCVWLDERYQLCKKLVLWSQLFTSVIPLN